MKLNLEEVSVIFQISNAIDIAGITNEEIDKLIDFQDGLEKSIERTNKKIEKVFQSEKLERTGEAINSLKEEERERIINRINEVSFVEVKPLKMFEKEVITNASKQFGLRGIRLAREVFLK